MVCLLYWSCQYILINPYNFCEYWPSLLWQAQLISSWLMLLLKWQTEEKVKVDSLLSCRQNSWQHIQASGKNQPLPKRRSPLLRPTVFQEVRHFFFSYIFISWTLITLQYCSKVMADMNQPWLYMYSPSRFPLPPRSLPSPSGSSQCTRPEHLSHASKVGWWSVSP